MDDVTVFFGGVVEVADIPAEGFEEGVEEITAEFGLVVAAGFVGGECDSKRVTRSIMV